MTRNKKYTEDTKTIGFRVPISLADILKTSITNNIDKFILEYYPDLIVNVNNNKSAPGALSKK